MAWERESLRYSLYTFAGRGSVLTNTSAAPFVETVESGGRLAGVSNESTLLHLLLPLGGGGADYAAAPPSSAAAVHVVLEVLPNARTCTRACIEPDTPGSPERTRPASVGAGLPAAAAASRSC